MLHLGSQDRAFLELTGPLDGQLTYQLESFDGIVTTQGLRVALTRDQIKRIEFPTAAYDRSGINWVEQASMRTEVYWNRFQPALR